MFNLSGSEILFLLLIGLVVLGPEKLPDAMRKAGRLYQEVRKITGGLQSDIKATLEDPMNELRKTADQAKRVITGTDDPADAPGSTTSGTQSTIPRPTQSPEPGFIPYEAPIGPTTSSENITPEANSSEQADPS